MRKIKILADSAADLLTFDGADFQSVPMKIETAECSFTDDSALDVDVMTAYFEAYKGKSRSSCPNVSDWVEAFGDADEVYCVTITSNLSGSYNAACIAKQMYEAEHEDRRVFVLDTLSAGPEMKLVIEKLAEYIKADMTYESICEQIQAYLSETGLVFILKSLNNFANNGRVSPLVAKFVGFAGIHVVGKASEKGDLEPLKKCRGEKRALEELASLLNVSTVPKRKIRIAHCNNENAAENLKRLILEKQPDACVEIYRCRGLCSFYAEQGGLLVGYERG